MTATRCARAIAPSAVPAPRPTIPSVAWTRAIGEACADVGHPRVAGPMVDDGEWAGVPIGGLGSGSIGRTFRGDFARWHLEVGRHVFQPVAADAFSVFVGGPDGSGAHVLTTLRPTDLPGWGWDLPVGAGTYHALFPRAWQTFEPDALGIRLVGEQLSPVIAGDLVASALPVGVFEWWIENTTQAPLTVGLMLSWANPLGTAADEARPAGPWQETVRDADAAGIVFHDGDSGRAGLRGTFAIAAAETPGVTITTRSQFDARFDRDLWADFAADGRLDEVDETDGHDGGRVTSAGQTTGAAVVATVDLAPGDARSVRFAIAWDLPIVEFGSGRRWWKRYTRDWGRTASRAFDLATHALAQADRWRSAIETWQRPIVEDPHRPAWYRAALFNELYFLVDGGTFWDDGEVGVSADAEDSHFGSLECVDYPFYNTVDVNASASLALLRQWPELETRVVRDVLAAVPYGDTTPVEIEATGTRAPRKVAWSVPHDVGGPADDPFVRPNWYRFQDCNGWKDLGPKLVLQAWRDYRATSDPRILEDAWPVVGRVVDSLAAFDRDGDGLPDHDGVPDQTYDMWPMRGPSAYGGTLWLAALRAAEEMAKTVRDEQAAARFAAMFGRARDSFERRLWRGGYYAFDDGDGPSSDSIMADQLAGVWYADVARLGEILDPARVRTALRTIHANNVCGFAGGGMGAVNGMAPDGIVDRSCEQSQEVWVGTTYTLAALMLRRGLDAEAWQTAKGATRVTYERGLWFRTPEAYDSAGNFRASVYMRPLAIWAIEEALTARSGD